MDIFIYKIFAGVLSGGVLATLLFFAFTTFWYRDKYFKKKDEFLELANNSNFFSKRNSIMWESEKKLFHVLLKHYGEKYHIFPQISLATILDIKPDFKDHDNLFREIDHRSIDFVFTDKENMSPILVIELNGESHWYQINRKNRDKLIEDIITKANIKFLAVNKTDNYEESGLLESINKKLIDA